MELKITEVHFKIHKIDYQIILDNPIIASSYEELRKKAQSEVEMFMIKTSIIGPYKLYYL